jgi:hypothetical protein
MPPAAETVTLGGSSLVFQNTYGPGVTEDYRLAILTAEHAFQAHFDDAVTVSMRFDLEAMDASISGHNVFAITPVSYDQLVAALASHATTAVDAVAVAGLPATDPSQGVGFWLCAPQARVLGLAPDAHELDDTVVLNSALPFTFGADAVGVLEHEISEGVFGRVSSLGAAEPAWQPMDLFRFDASGQRDFTGGADGVATFFGLDGAHLSQFQFHNAISASGEDDGFDLADWDNTAADAFGPGGPGQPGQMSATDLQALDVLGWTPAAHQGASAAAAGGLLRLWEDLPFAHASSHFGGFEAQP